MYVIQDRPDSEIMLEGEMLAHPVLAHPICTLADEYGGRAQIIEDDHCLVLFLLRNESGRYRSTAWWFKEAVEAVRRLEGVWPPLQYAPGSPSADTTQGGL
jgi:hypothetical protein